MTLMMVSLGVGALAGQDGQKEQTEMLARATTRVEAIYPDLARKMRISGTVIAAEQAQVVLDQTNYVRDTTLLHSGTVSQAIYDQAQSTLDTDKSELESLRQQTQVQLARLDGNADIPAAQHPQYLQAQARVEEARRRARPHRDLRAVCRPGHRFSAIAPGKYLAASTTAFYLVDTDHA